MEQTDNLLKTVAAMYQSDTDMRQLSANDTALTPLEKRLIQTVLRRNQQVRVLADYIMDGQGVGQTGK